MLRMVDKEYIRKSITLKVGRSERLVEIAKYRVRPYVKPLKIPIYLTINYPKKSVLPF